MTSLTDKNIQRFWGRVALPDSSDCMLWLGSRNVYGYGRLSFQGRWVGVHRISLLLAVGQPPEDKPEAAHSCRNRHCAAPNHLRWADRKEQSADKERDGTALRGESHGQSKLTAEDVRGIRTKYANGNLQQALAEEYGVHQTQISRIVLGKRWQRV